MKSFKFLAMLLFTALVSSAWATEITIEANGQTISDAATWENCTVNITGDGTVTFGSRIYINGDVALNLGAGATLIANGGIGVHEGNSLTIDGEGNLTANSNTFSEAAIGGSYGSPNAGTITISGGTVNASNNSKGVSAAIGGGYSNYGGNGTIIINGGTITTNIIQGGAASIGGSKGANGGHITIAGGSITANRSGAVTGAGIGGGEKGNAGIIIISGGTVTVPASSSARGAGIGSGEKSDGEGSITINDGNITAVGGAIGGSAGIGGGSNSSAGTITITGGVVNATGGYESAGIGGARGVNGSGGTIAISGGQVTARGSDGAYGIGPSKDGAEGTISMSWTDNTDFIDASYAGTITILKGKRFFYDETEMFAKAEGLYKQEKKIIPAVLDNSLLSSGEILMQRNFVTTEGTAVDVSYEVYDYNGDKLTDGTDYTAVIKNSNDQIVTTVDQLGDYTLTVTGMGNYSGSNAYTFSLVEWDMALMQDGSEHYVNLPENGTKTVYLNVGQSIKVYDSEGKDGKLVVSDGRLLLHVPTGYALVVSGKTDAMKWNEAQHDTTNFLSAYENENLTDEITSLFGNSNNISFASAGNSMLIRLNAQKIYRYDDQYGLELTISVQKSLSHSDITIATIPNQTYSGSEICPAVVVNDGEATLILGTDYTVECANNVSAGTANMAITGMGDYPGSISKTFEILKAPLTVTGVSVENKVYDGSTSATITGTATVSGVLDSDDVGVEYGTAVFAEANVGEGIAVAFSGFTLTGADKNNYYLSDQPANVTANITKAPLTVTAKNDTITYGDEPPNASVEYSGFVGEEDESVLNGTLAYECKYDRGGAAGKYDVTPGGLTAENYDIEFVTG
ncbi:YDG domain-containing protein, partial [Fibrobacter sp. UWH4]|uniref:YDG domain-containing protein n=1 Tax=Fibrobacter sp. UWH4 TaxID=1896210 RepID=UPI000913225A